MRGSRLLALVAAAALLACGGGATLDDAARDAAAALVEAVYEADNAAMRAVEAALAANTSAAAVQLSNGFASLDLLSVPTTTTTTAAQPAGGSRRSGRRPTVTLAIPCGPGHRALVPGLLAAVRHQTEQPLEVVVAMSEATADDAAALQEAIGSYDVPVHLLFDPRTLGPGPNRNRAAAAASGDVVSFFDADDRMHPQRIETVAAAFGSAGDEVKAVLHRFSYPKDDGVAGGGLDASAILERGTHLYDRAVAAARAPGGCAKSLGHAFRELRPAPHFGHVSVRREVLDSTWRFSQDWPHWGKVGDATFLCTLLQRLGRSDSSMVLLAAPLTLYLPAWTASCDDARVFGTVDPGAVAARVGCRVGDGGEVRFDGPTAAAAAPAVPRHVERAPAPPAGPLLRQILIDGFADGRLPLPPSTGFPLVEHYMQPWLRDRVAPLLRGRDVRDARCLEWGDVYISAGGLLGGRCAERVELVYSSAYRPSVDVRPTSQERAAAGGATTSIFGDIDDLGGALRAGETFDVIVSTMVLEHVAHPTAASASMAAALSPGGHLVLAVPFFEPNHGAPWDYHRFTWQAAVRHAREAGLCVVSVEVFGGPLEVFLALLALPPLGAYATDPRPPPYKSHSGFHAADTCALKTHDATYLGVGLVACKPPGCSCALDQQSEELLAEPRAVCDEIGYALPADNVLGRAG